MLEKLNIYEIRKDAISFLKKETNTFMFFSIYYIIPLAISITIIMYCKYELNSKIFSDLIGGISLFSGLLFSIIFIVSNNYKDRKMEFNTDDDENKRYLSRYYTFSSNLISLISYVIIKALTIIILLIASSMYFDYINEKTNLIIEIIWVLLLTLLYQFLIYVIIILKEIYAMQYEDINK